MNIVYIIGNGFDLNIGMKTSNKDFYKYYKSIHSESSLVNKLKKDISSNYETWSDLESGIGNYTEKIESIEDFDELFDNLRDELSNYIKRQEEEFDFTDLYTGDISKSLAYPENFLPIADTNSFGALRSKWNNSNWKIDIITLNYSRSLEKILG